MREYLSYCPFCIEGDAEEKKTKDGKFFIQCKSCGARTGISKFKDEVHTWWHGSTYGLR